VLEEHISSNYNHKKNASLVKHIYSAKQYGNYTNKKYYINKELFFV